MPGRDAKLNGGWRSGSQALTENGISTSEPSGLTFTEDSVTEGYESEFFAQPTENWTITLNAAKVEATRNNVGGDALRRYVDLVNDDLNNTAAGDLRIWWGGAGSTTTLQEWNTTFNAPFNLTRLLEGTATPELREWRANLVTNYAFSDGVLSSFNVGGSYRWQDNVVIGYPPSCKDDGGGTAGTAHLGGQAQVRAAETGFRSAGLKYHDKMVRIRSSNEGNISSMVPDAICESAAPVVVKKKPA